MAEVILSENGRAERSPIILIIHFFGLAFAGPKLFVTIQILLLLKPRVVGSVPRFHPFSPPLLLFSPPFVGEKGKQGL